MKAEWSNVSFDVKPYRETGVGVLSAVEDVQQTLDDHILRAQTMRSSVGLLQRSYACSWALDACDDISGACSSI